MSQQNCHILTRKIARCIIQRKMKTIDALDILTEYDGKGHTVWSLSDLHIVFCEKPATFRKTLERLCAAGILERVSRGTYLFVHSNRNRRMVFGELIGQLRSGEYSFESLESAASAWGIIPQTPLGGITVMTTGRSGRVRTPFGPVEFVHTEATIQEILTNTVQRDDFIPLASKSYTIHGLRRCARTTELDEALARGWEE